MIYKFRDYEKTFEALEISLNYATNNIAFTITDEEDYMASNDIAVPMEEIDNLINSLKTIKKEINKNKDNE